MFIGSKVVYFWTKFTWKFLILISKQNLTRYVTKFTEVSESWIFPLCVSYISYLYMKKTPCVGNWSEPYLFKAILSNNNSIKLISFTTSFKRAHKTKPTKPAVMFRNDCSMPFLYRCLSKCILFFQCIARENGSSPQKIAEMRLCWYLRVHFNRIISQ